MASIGLSIWFQSFDLWGRKRCDNNFIIFAPISCVNVASIGLSIWFRSFDLWGRRRCSNNFIIFAPISCSILVFLVGCYSYNLWHLGPFIIYHSSILFQLPTLYLLQSIHCIGMFIAPLGKYRSKSLATWRVNPAEIQHSAGFTRHGASDLDLC